MGFGGIVSLLRRVRSVAKTMMCGPVEPGKGVTESSMDTSVSHWLAMEEEARYLCMDKSSSRSTSKAGGKCSSLWRRTSSALTRGKKAESEGGKLVLLRRKIVRRKSSVVSKKGKDWSMASRLRRRSTAVQRKNSKKWTVDGFEKKEAKMKEEQMDSWTIPGEVVAKTKAEPRRRKSVQRKTTILAKRRPAVKKSQSFVSKSAGRGKEKSKGRLADEGMSKALLVAQEGYKPPQRWSAYLREGEQRRVEGLPRTRPELSSEDDPPILPQESAPSQRTREDYRRGVEEVERSRGAKANKARKSSQDCNQRAKEAPVRKKEMGRADTDSGIHSSSSSFLESTRGGQSFYRTYYWPSCCREVYGQQQFYPPAHPYYSRQAALSWQHLLLTTLPPAYLRMPPQTGSFPRFGGNPGSKRRSHRYRRTSEQWGRMRRSNLVGRSMPNLSSSSNESSEEDEEREWEEEEVEVRPEVRTSFASKVKSQNAKKYSTTIKVQSKTFSQRMPHQIQGTVRSVPDKFDKWTSEPIFV